MKKYLIAITLIISGILLKQLPVMASEGDNFTTITIDASDNETEPGSLMYAIDTDDPSAFTTDNEFVVEAGTSHVVYVKDAAGNISSQMITAPIEKVGIEVTIGEGGTDSSITSDSVIPKPDAAEPGGGTVHEKTVTDGSSDSEKIFYTITTQDENVFYMVIDSARTSDNVYLLNQVTEEDLLSLVQGADAKESKKIPLYEEKEETIPVENTEPETEHKDTDTKKKSNLPIIILVVVLMGGTYYYLKVYKVKKAEEMDMADAMDMDEFLLEEENIEDEEVVFEEEEKEKLLQKIVDKAKTEEGNAAQNDYTDDYAAEREENRKFLNLSIDEIDAEMDDMETDGTWEEEDDERK